MNERPRSIGGRTEGPPHPPTLECEILMLILWALHGKNEVKNRWCPPPPPCSEPLRRQWPEGRVPTRLGVISETRSAVSETKKNRGKRAHAQSPHLEFYKMLNPRTGGGLSQPRTGGGGLISAPPPEISRTTQRIEKR